MKLYRMSFSTKDNGVVCVWATSKEAAAQAERQFRIDEACDGSLGIEPIEVPTTRSALVDFLNQYANRDNG